MPEDESTKKQSEAARPEWEGYLQRFLAAVPPVDPATKSSAEQAFKQLSDFAQRGHESLSSTMTTMFEFMQEVTNIKGVDVQLKSWRSIEVKMHIMREADIPVNHDIVGIGKIEAIRLSKLIHMQAEIGEDNKDVRAHFHQGMSMVVNIIFVGKQVIPMKGTAKLLQDAKGQILVETTSYIPGTDMPVTVTFPLKTLLDEVRKGYKI